MPRAEARAACCLTLLLMLFAVLPTVGVAQEHTPPPLVFDVLAPTEQEWLRVLEAVETGDSAQAIELSAALAQKVSGFALLDKLRQELLAAQGEAAMAQLQARWLTAAASVPTAPQGAAPDEASRLAHEAAQRWAHRDYQVPTTLPFVLALDRGVRHLIVVETSTSRLFLFRNRPEGLRLERDLYVSIGRRGPGKEVEGDERTPLGVYFTLSRMDEEGLAERYGAHAFPLDYPNAWDRRGSRTGRGIWIHGVPPQTYSRPPLDSDGCVALTNPDIQWLAKRLAPRRTPVVVVERVPWDAASPSTAEVARLSGRIERWLDARAQGEDGASALEELYEPEVLAVPVAGAGLEREDEAPEVRRLALIQDPTTQGLVVASFGDGLGGWYRQYWRQDDAGSWRIAAERLRPPRRR